MKAQFGPRHLLVQIIGRLAEFAGDGFRTHTYGSAPQDYEPVGEASETIVLVQHSHEGRWYRVSVEEVFPNGDPIREPLSSFLHDTELAGTLARRAGIPSPYSGSTTAPG
jgi:hypothetical protein